MQLHKLFASVAVLSLALLAPQNRLAAQKSGANIYTKTGVLRSPDGGPPSVKDISIRVPQLNRAYEVKVNFLKVEISAAAVDAYVDELNKQALARGEAPGSAKWDELRERLKKTTSKADFEVFEGGTSVGRATDLGATTFFRTVKFTANRYDYTVRLRCLQGAGLYHLTLEWL